MRALCERLSVSIATLDRVVRELEEQGIVERRHGIGIFVSKSLVRRSIGLVYTENIFRAGASPFSRQLVAEARRRATERDERFQFYMIQGENPGQALSATELLQDADRGRIDGLIAVGTDGTEPEIDALLKTVTPVIAFTRATVGCPCVTIDYDDLISKALAAVATLGCRSVAHLPLPDVSNRLAPAENVLSKNLAAAGLNSTAGSASLLACAKTVWSDGGKELSLQEFGFRTVTTALLASPGHLPFDAIVSANDMATQGVLAALRKAGLRPGKEVQIATHANLNSPALLGYEEDIIRLEIDPRTIVDLLFGYLESWMDGRKPAENVVPVRATLRLPLSLASLTESRA